MKDIIDAFDRCGTIVAVADVAFDEAEAVGEIREFATDFIQVALMPG